ncbi:hypothetical protein M231_02448 [Tremella mesenterica]|uniref:Uncharacterized protein n=1 Tax=Tremella mesenterica TaxID=5217 RepID=A0A4Q1BQV9_TREME|nr:hypothetical protein M231_02448 [Tremella mesenterica]
MLNIAVTTAYYGHPEIVVNNFPWNEHTRDLYKLGNKVIDSQTEEEVMQTLGSSGYIRKGITPGQSRIIEGDGHQLEYRYNENGEPMTEVILHKDTRLLLEWTRTFGQDIRTTTVKINWSKGSYKWVEEKMVQSDRFEKELRQTVTFHQYILESVYQEGLIHDVKLERSDTKEILFEAQRSSTAMSIRDNSMQVPEEVLEENTEENPEVWRTIPLTSVHEDILHQIS